MLIIGYRCVCDICYLRLLYWLYPLYGFIGSYFLRYIHELISFIHFMMNSCYSFMCYCFMLDLLIYCIVVP